MADDRIVVRDANMVVQRPCADNRADPDDYPDIDEKLAAIPRGDFETLGKVARTGRDLRDARLKVDEVQIAGCAR